MLNLLVPGLLMGGSSEEPAAPIGTGSRIPAARLYVPGAAVAQSCLPGLAGAQLYQSGTAEAEVMS